MLESIDRIPILWAAVGYALVWALAGVLTRSLVRRWLEALAAARPSEWTEVLAKSLPRPAGVAVFLIALAAGLRALPLQGTGLLAAHRVAAVAFALLGVTVLMRVAFRAIDAFGRSNPGLASTAGIGKAVTWVLGLGVTAVLVSDALGVSLAPALTALGVGSVAVALGLQDTLSNFFAGVYLVVDKPLRPGDYIRVDPSYEGYVEAIGWHSTQLRTQGANLVIIPNTALSKAVITNYALPTPRVASSVRVDVAVDADLDRVEDALADEARRAADLPGIADAPAPGVVMNPGFVDGVVAFTVYFHVRSYAQQGDVQHALRKRIAARFKRDGLALASLRAAILKKDP